MTNVKDRGEWVELAVGVPAAAVAALALAAAGLSEVSWAPFFLVAAASGRQRRSSNPLWRGVRQ